MVLLGVLIRSVGQAKKNKTKQNKKTCLFIRLLVKNFGAFTEVIQLKEK